MIAEGFVPAPHGGRANADYDEDHVAAIRRYSILRRQGLPPQAIKVLLASGMTAPFTVAPGIVLHIDPAILGQEVDINDLEKRVRTVLSDVFMEPSHASDNDDDNRSR